MSDEKTMTSTTTVCTPIAKALEAWDEVVDEWEVRLVNQYEGYRGDMIETWIVRRKPPISVTEYDPDEVSHYRFDGIYAKEQAQTFFRSKIIEAVLKAVE